MNKNNTSAIPSIPPGVTLTTLDNGLTIIVREDHNAPVVSAQAWCAAGSIHEGKWLGGGLSHVLEHMLFKGTTTRPGSRIDQEVQEAGGYMNAYTSFDRTVYHIDVPNTGAVKAIDILCDIMQHATLPPDELAKEMDVIRREMDMCHDDPGRRASRRLFETAYTKSPYRFTIIGYPDIFNEVKPDDIRDYYTEKYAPNNVFYVVAGDVKNSDGGGADQSRLRAAASPAPCRRWCCRWNRSQTAAARDHRGIRRWNSGHVHFAWHIPEVRHADVPVLDVLSVLLGSGRSSRLFQQVREKQGVAHHVDAWTYSPGLPGLFGVSAMVDGDKFEAARDAILAEIEKVKIAFGLRRRTAKGHEAIHLRHAVRAEDHGRPGPESWRQLAGGQRPEFFRALSRRGQAGDHRRCPARDAALSHAGKPHAVRAAAHRQCAQSPARTSRATPIIPSGKSNWPMG